MQLKRYGRKGCEVFAVRIKDTRESKTTSYGDDYIYEDGEIGKKLKESFEEKYLYLKNYQDVFPEELPGLPPSKVFDFTIDIIPRAEPLSRVPYRMTTTELMELQIQLQDMLDKKMIRTSVSTWGAPVFCKKEGWNHEAMHRLQDA